MDPAMSECLVDDSRGVCMLLFFVVVVVFDAGPVLQQTPPVTGARIIDMLIVGP